MSTRRQVWATLSRLLARVESGMEPESPNGLTKEIRKLGKAQFKANALTENQIAHLEETITALQKAQAENAKMRETLAEERAAAARSELLETILPAVDGVENAIASGQKYLKIRDKAAASQKLTPERAALVSPADRAMLAGWLDGLRLVRERLLGILEAGSVTPIPTIGHPFDPYMHIAVGTTSEVEDEVAAGTIVAEERPGYRTTSGV
ncbi:MAG: nucleotide exchange factor GrpE, partial [Anaerolineales bacterium]